MEKQKKKMKGKTSIYSQCFWSIHQFCPILNGNLFSKLLQKTIKHISDILTEFKMKLCLVLPEMCSSKDNRKRIFYMEVHFHGMKSEKLAL